MKKSRFTEQQIVGILKESEAGANTAELCRKHGVSPATFYKWKSKFGGMEVSDVAKMRTLEDQNRRLKRLLADARRRWLRSHRSAMADIEGCRSCIDRST